MEFQCYYFIIGVSLKFWCLFQQVHGLLLENGIKGIKKLARGPGDLVAVIQARNDEAWKSSSGDDEWTDSRNSRILWLIRCLRRAQGECSGTCGSQPWVPEILCSLIQEICKRETVCGKSWKTCHVVGKQTSKTKHDLRIEIGDGGCFHALNNRASLENTQNELYCFGMLFF